jgi:uncharacterized protein
MQPDQAKLDELVRRIVEAVHPLRITLFGSAARGEMTPDSDVDVLVVMPEGTHRLDVMDAVHMRMLGLHLPVDVLVTTEAALAEHRDDAGLIYRTVLEEGRDLYAA